jgi:hypothetical protein
MKRIYFILPKEKKPGTNNDTVIQKEAKIEQDQVKDSAAIRNTVMEFYDWYNKNYTKFEAYTLYTSIKKKDNPPYKMNWEEVEKYLTFIHESVPQLGEAFINNQRQFFRQCDSAFKVDVEDDIPYGFDYDWYTNSQEEPQVLIDELNQSKQWVTTVNGDDAHVTVKGIYMDNGKQTETTVINIDLKKEKGKWTIARIAP